MDIFNFSPQDILSYFLTLIRISVVLFVMPIFGGKSIPKQVKASLVLILSFALFPALSFPAELMPSNIIALSIMLMGEVLLGLVLGLLVLFLLTAVQFGGQIAGFGMGFTMVNVVDPVTGVSEAVTAHFLYMCTILVFLSLNGHLAILKAVADSFTIVKPGELLLSAPLVESIFQRSANIFVLAIRIASPIVAAIFLVDLALALIARSAPQMNLLILGFPIKITVGFLFLGMMFQIMARYVEQYVSGLGILFRTIMQMGVQ